MSESAEESWTNKFRGGFEVDESKLDKCLPNYLVINEKKADSYGTVFKGRNTKSQALVSIRVLPVPASEFPGGESDFSNYFASYAQFQNPGFTEILDYGATGQDHLYVISKAEENDLDSGATVELDQLIAIYAQTLESLKWLHSQGISHGSITPDNILLDDAGNVKIDGLGLAGLTAAIRADVTSLSNADFTAPEITSLTETTAQSDLYSVGVCLYRSLTGQLPKGLFELPSEINGALSKRLDEVVTNSLKSSPSKRWSDAAKMREALLASTVSPPAAAPASPAGRPTLNLSNTPPKPASKTASQSGSPAKQNEAKSSSLPPGLWIACGAILMLGLGYLLFQKNSSEKTTTKPRYAESVVETDPIADRDSPEEEEEPPEPEIDRESRISSLLIDLRVLVPHCPNIQAEVSRNANLGALLRYAESLNLLILESEDPDFANFVLSDDLAERVSSSINKARLSRFPRPPQSGSLISWGAQPESEAAASASLPNFTGPDQKIVGFSGTPEAGLALTLDGEISQWGQEIETIPEVDSPLFIDARGYSFAALSETGTVTTWGSGFSGKNLTEDWESIARMSVGDGFILGVTDEFKVVAAGTDEDKPIEIPKAVQDDKIIAVGSISDTAYAVSAEGTVYHWSKYSRLKKMSVFAPIFVQATPRNLFIQSADRDITRFDAYGDKHKVDFGSDDDDIVIPRFSPDDSMFAVNRGTSRWVLTNESSLDVDTAYWQETSRGAIDILLGADKFLGIVPRANSGTPISETDALPAEQVDTVTIEGIPIPTLTAFRDWTPTEGTPRRAKLIEVTESDEVKLWFTDGKIATMPLSRFSEADQKYASDWEPPRGLDARRIQNSLAILSPEQFIKDVGYEPVDLEIRDGYAMIEIAVGGVNSELVVDTGATNTIVAVDLADRVGIPLAEKSYILTWQGRVEAFSGRAKNISLGMTDFEDVNLFAVNLNTEQFGSAGLLGIDLMQKSRAILDLGHNQILFRGSKRSSPAELYEAETRQWKLAEGTSFEGKLEAVEGTTAKINDSEGEIVEVKFSELGGENLEYVDAFRTHVRYLNSFQKEKQKLELSDLFAKRQREWDEVKVSMQNKTQVLKVVLEGREMEFFVDTGAPYTQLSIAAARDLGRTTRNMEVVGRASGIEGNPVPVYATEFGSFQIGGQIFHDYRMRVYDFENMSANRFSGTSYDGVIGTDLLIRLRAIIDMDRNRILFSRE